MKITFLGGESMSIYFRLVEYPSYIFLTHSFFGINSATGVQFSTPFVTETAKLETADWGISYYFTAPSYTL